jgi:hypothetical protein
LEESFVSLQSASASGELFSNSDVKKDDDALMFSFKITRSKTVKTCFAQIEEECESDNDSINNRCESEEDSINNRGSELEDERVCPQKTAMQPALLKK